MKPHTILDIEKEEVEYLAASTSFFTKKHLIIKNEKDAETVGLSPEESHYVSDDELKKILKGGKVSDFHSYIDSIVGDVPQIARVRKLAPTLDLQSSRVKYINEKLNQDI